MSEIFVSSAAQLKTALSVARDGDTISLKGGAYGDVTISGVSFASGVTITSADAGAPASFHSLNIVGSKGLDFSGVNIDFTPTMTTYAFSSALRINTSSDISFTGGKIVGGPAINGVSPDAPVGTSDSTGNVLGLYTGRGVSIEKSSDVTIANSDISALMKGVVLTEVTGLKVSGNAIHDTRTGMVTGVDVSNAVIENNNIYSSNPHNFSGAGDHADFIHLWTELSRQTSASENIVIRGNMIEQGDGQAILGIYLDDNGNGLGFKNVDISQNVILNGNYQGMRLENVFDSSVTGNTLLQTSGEAKTAPAILLRNGSQNLDIHGNIVAGVDLSGNGAVANQIGQNTIVQTGNPAAAGYYTADYALQLSKLYSSADGIFSLVYKMASSGTISSPQPTPTPTPEPTPAPSRPAATALNLVGGGADDLLQGGAGADTLSGGDGADTLVGGAGDDVMIGGAGDDLFYVKDAGDVVVEAQGGGSDTVGAWIDYTLGANVEDLRLAGSATVGTGNELDNRISATDLSSQLNGMAGSDTLIGRNGDDTLSGGTGDDLLQGQAGSDSLSGGDGDDRLYGGAGNDTLSGGAGADHFAFSTVDLSAKPELDVIVDFSRVQGDKINLSAIDANVLTAKNDAFAFIGQNGFHKIAGELNYKVVNGDAIVSGDVNGDGVADFMIQVKGVTSLVATDFIL